MPGKLRQQLAFQSRESQVPEGKPSALLGRGFTQALFLGRLELDNKSLHETF